MSMEVKFLILDNIRIYVVGIECAYSMNSLNFAKVRSA